MSYSRVPNTDRMTSLKVDNLTDRTTSEDLKRVFEQFGDIGDVYIPRHPCTGENQGFAFVRFYDRDAQEAMDALDRHLLDGRGLRVQMAVPAISSGDPDRSSSLSRFISVLGEDPKESLEPEQREQFAHANQETDDFKVMEPGNKEEMIAWVLKGANVKQPTRPENLRLYSEHMRKFKPSGDLGI